MRLGILLAASALLVATTPASADLRWIDGSNGYLPSGAVQGGHEANGQALYVCRARFSNGVHIGKFRADWRGCNIGFGGREHTINNYQILVEN